MTGPSSQVGPPRRSSSPGFSRLSSFVGRCAVASQEQKHRMNCASEGKENIPLGASRQHVGKQLGHQQVIWLSPRSVRGPVESGASSSDDPSARSLRFGQPNVCVSAAAAHDHPSRRRLQAALYYSCRQIGRMSIKRCTVNTSSVTRGL